MKVPKFLAVGLIAAGLAVGGSTAAHAATESPYVTVAWSFPAYPDVTAPQPYIGVVPGANLAAFDALAASPEWCGKPIQVDVYQRTDKHGISWEVLKETGSLLYGHDGGILAYNAGVGTPYRVITPKEYPCTTPTPSPTTEPTGTPSPTPPVPSSEPSETPTHSPAPSDEPTSTPTPTPSPSASSTPEPSGTPTPPPTASTPPDTEAPTPTPAASTPVPVPAQTSPSGTTSVSSTTRSSSVTPEPSRTASPVAAASTSPDELAYTGSDPRPGIAAALVLVLSGLALLVVKRRRRA